MDVGLPRHGAQAWGFAIDVADRDRAVTKEFITLKSRVKLLDFANYLGNFVNRIIALLGHRAMARLAQAGDANLHAATLTTEDLAISRIGDDDHIGPDFVFLDDVLPAQAVAVFFHHRERREQAKLRH